MSERDEIYLRQIKSTWQSRQDSAGMVTLLLGLATFCSFLLFVSAPGGQIASVMGCFMVLLLLSCVRLLSSAAKVVEIGRILSPSRSNPEIIEAEVVDSFERRR